MYPFSTAVLATRCEISAKDCKKKLISTYQLALRKKKTEKTYDIVPNTVEVNPLLIPVLPRIPCNRLLDQQQEKATQIVNVHAPPNAQPPPHLHGFAALQRDARQLRHLHAAPLDGAPAGPEDDAARHERGADVVRLGGDVEDEVVDGARGVLADVRADVGGAVEVVVDERGRLAEGLAGDLGGAEETGAGDLDPVGFFGR